ncbi:hypothetical protein BDZ89DRAFT_14862 [Hymenopellis radicata]|nr:hypothetical protein BDZ89DRAFT_14862 [Hymenopellis radicata]
MASSALLQQIQAGKKLKKAETHGIVWVGVCNACDGRTTAIRWIVCGWYAQAKAGRTEQSRWGRQQKVVISSGTDLF